MSLSFFFFNDTATTEIYTLSLHDALPIYAPRRSVSAAPHPHVARGGNHGGARRQAQRDDRRQRSEEHTSELQSPCNLVCRLLLEKKKRIYRTLVHSTLTMCGCTVATALVD